MDGEVPCTKNAGRTAHDPRSGDLEEDNRAMATLMAAVAGKGAAAAALAEAKAKLGDAAYGPGVSGVGAREEMVPLYREPPYVRRALAAGKGAYDAESHGNRLSALKRSNSEGGMSVPSDVAVDAMFARDSSRKTRSALMRSDHDAHIKLQVRLASAEGAYTHAESSLHRAQDRSDRYELSTISEARKGELRSMLKLSQLEEAVAEAKAAMSSTRKALDKVPALNIAEIFEKEDADASADDTATAAAAATIGAVSQQPQPPATLRWLCDVLVLLRPMLRSRLLQQPEHPKPVPTPRLMRASSPKSPRRTRQASLRASKQSSSRSGTGAAVAA